jgi:predicted amidohydrolase YtcJ
MLSEIQLDDYPVFLQRICGHAVLVNEKVLRFAGISAKTPDPPAGVIGRDPSTGEPNGILKEDAIRLVSQYLPRQGADSVRTFLEYALAEARRFGVTSVQDLSGADALSLYKGFLDEEKLTCRISVGFPLENNLSDGLKARQALKGAMLHFGLFKGILDGSMGARTALFFEPYTDDPSTSGIPQLSESSLYDMTYSADSARFQMALHAIGDRAVHMALDAFERFPPREGVPERRNRIEHAQVVDGADFGRFRALGVIASVQPSHCIFDMAWAESRIGPERCRRAYAWKTLLRSGARLAFGSDWPVAPLNPVVGLYAAVSRRDTTGLPEGGWHPEERLSIEEAILAYTLGSAAAEFMENEKGSLEQGKLADLVIFDRNLTTCTHEELLDAQVVRTVVDGKIVYEQNP